MTDRTQKVEGLLADFQSLKRTMAFRMPGSADMPRITPSQWGMLAFVEHQGESTVKSAAKALGITSSAATQLVDGLVASGYLVREASAKDRRTVILTLSKRSKNSVEKLKKYALQKFLKVFKALDDREFEQYLALNKKIVRGFLGKRS